MTDDPKENVRLLVNGSEYGGWKGIRITPGIERQARDFELKVTDVWPGDKALTIAQRVMPGDKCQVFIGDQLVLTGYVDGTPISHDGTKVSVSVKGRSKTADLVDCSPVQGAKGKASGGATSSSWSDVKGAGDNPQKAVKAIPSSNQFANQKLETIAAALAAPYGVKVIAEVDTGRPIPNHQIQQGETVFQSIDRMMRLRHVLSSDDEYGNLVILNPGSAGKATTALEVGKNILTGSCPLDYSSVFSEYICKGQRKGTDDEFGADVSEGSASSDDDDEGIDNSGDSGESIEASGNYVDRFGPKRFRLLVLKQNGQADEGTLQDRVRYERAHRAAKALETTYSVVGWRQEDGSLWRPNLLVPVVDSIIGFNDEMLIAEVDYILDENGERAQLRVGPPDGYVTKAAQTAKKRSRGGGSSWGDVK